MRIWFRSNSIRSSRSQNSSSSRTGPTTNNNNRCLCFSSAKSEGSFRNGAIGKKRGNTCSCLLRALRCVLCPGLSSTTRVRRERFPRRVKELTLHHRIVNVRLGRLVHHGHGLSVRASFLSGCQSKLTARHVDKVLLRVAAHSLVILHLLLTLRRNARFRFGGGSVQTFLSLLLNGVGQEEGKLFQQVGVVLKQVHHLFQHFLDSALFLLVHVQDLDKRVIRIRVTCKALFDGRHIRNGVIKLDGLMRCLLLRRHGLLLLEWTT